MAGTQPKEADVMIVGAGAAGATLASLLGPMGLDVVLADPLDPMPPLFRAEKIEPDQADLLRKFGLLEGLLPWTARIRRVDEARAGRILLTVALEQYGVFFQDLINQLRLAIPAEVDYRKVKVVAVERGDEGQLVRLDDGSEVRARLVVFAAGGSLNAQKLFGLSRREISRPHCMAFGFTLSQVSEKNHASDALTYFGDKIDAGIDFISLFPICDVLRANLFSYWHPKDPRVKALAAQPVTELDQLLPGFTDLAGKLELVGKVQSIAIDLDTVEGHHQPGLVVVGDAYQAVAPTTGTGLSKVLTDVDCLVSHLPTWFASPGMAADKIASFYNDPRKVASDRHSLEMGLRMRKTAIDPSLRWQLQRTARHIKKGVQAWHPRFNPNTHLARAS